MPKFKLIQVQRGLAALAVILLHINQSTKFYLNISWLNGIFVGGWFGVDFFFVLSGFIIFYVHHKDLENRTNIKLFFKKRFVRVFPIYWILASVCLFFLIFTGKLNWSDDFIYIIKSYLLIPQLTSPFLGVAWSLVFECFFYVIFGIGIFLGLRIMKYVLIVWLFLILVANTWSFPFSSSFIFSNFILEFLFGCIVSYHFIYNRNKIIINPNLFIYLGVFILLCMYLITLNTDFGTKASLASRFGYGIASSFLIYGAANFNTVNDKKINKFWLKLGDASYTLYLIHPIVLGIAYKSTAHFLKNHLYLSDYFGFFILSIVVIIGVFFHIYVEKKVIIFFSNRFSLKKKTLLD